MDVGCGNGSFLKFLYNKGMNDLSGVDFLYNEYDGINFYKGDFFEIDFSKKYDIVVSLAVIEHIEEPISYINRLLNLCKEGGKIIIMTINEDSILYKLSLFLYRLNISFPSKRLYDIHHLNHFNRSSFLKIFKGLGFNLQNSNNLLNNQMGGGNMKVLNTNFPIKAVDLPKSFISPILKALVYIIFKFTNKTKFSFLQTIILNKSSDVK